MTPADEGDGPAMIAHRGYSGVAPENTLAAFRAVADGRHPAEMIELDVVPCADGTPVVFHDSRLDAGEESRGITDRAGLVWETPRETVLGARVLDTEETVPTLATALEALPADVGVNVEFKNPGRADVRPGDALDAAEVAERRDRWDPFVQRVLEDLDDAAGAVLASSFHEPAIAAVRDYAPSLPVGALVAHSIEDGLTVAARYDCEAIHPWTEAVLDQLRDAERVDPSEDLLAAAAERGYDVNVWTVETWREAERLAAAGVDGLIADYPGLLGWRGTS